MLDLSPVDSLDVAVLCGGNSSQREMSLASGRAVAAALTETGHHVARFDPADVELSALNWHQFDVCYLALHGGAGEDGRVQSTLDALNVPYTGSRPQASLLAMSKLAGKERMRHCGVPTPEAVALWANEPLHEVAARLRPLGFPIVVKPDAQGASLGVGVARWLDELPDCLAAAGRFESLLLAERLIVGREFSVTLVEREPLPVLEILHQRRLFDHDAKTRGINVQVHGADARDPAVAAATQVALDAAAALDTAGLVRVDLIVDRDGQPWVLELNTLPDMSEKSLAPQAAALAGIDLSDLCNHLVQRGVAAREVPS